jgi:predicted dehydrogenase
MVNLKDTTSEKHNVSRRRFLKSSTGIAIGASMAGIMAFPKNVYAGVSETLRIGLIGAGLRGSAAAQNALLASRDNVLVSIGDVFADVARTSRRKLQRLETVKDQVQVADERLFSGFDAYKQVIDSGVDVVILAQPPYFRPQSLAYAVAQGKHMFVEKPVAVDAPGVRSVIDSCKLAEQKGLAVVSGLCWRYHPAVQETVRRIVEDKAIGDIIAIRSCYNAGELWHRGDKPDWSRMEYQIRNWIYFNWLSGDHICEQAVHSLDKTAWVQGDIQPTQAIGTGGRQQRTAERFGNVYDHHSVFYEYPTGVQVSFMCRQQKNCSDYVDEVVLGTKGQAKLLEYAISGEQPWRYEGKDAENYNAMYDLEHEALFRSIRDGKPINNGHYMCNSTMLAIMGRMCTYTGKTLTWDQCLNSQETLGPAKLDWSDEVPVCKVAIPGKSQFL